MPLTNVLSLDVSCISTGKDTDLSAFISRYILNYHPQSYQLNAMKSLIVFDKVVQVHIRKIFQGVSLLHHLESNSAAVGCLFSQTSGVLLVYDISDEHSFGAAQGWVAALCGASQGAGAGSKYGVLLGIRTSSPAGAARCSSVESAAAEARVEAAERFAYANNLRHFSIDLAKSSQSAINKPIDFLATLCAQRMFLSLHDRFPERVQKCVPSLALALQGEGGAGEGGLHMVRRPGERHTFQPPLLHAPSSHARFSPAFRRLVLLVLLYRRYGALSRLESRRVSLVATLPVEVSEREIERRERQIERERERERER
jgi:hypothetical protein